MQYTNDEILTSQRQGYVQGNRSTVITYDSHLKIAPPQHKDAMSVFMYFITKNLMVNKEFYFEGRNG